MMLFLLSPDTKAQNEKWEETFFRANQAYKEGLFQEAIHGYEHLIRSGHENGHIFYNLGNAYFRMSQLGRAILNYERARLLIPRDADLNFNLRYTRDQTRDAVAQSQGFISMTFFWVKNLTFAELLWSFVVVNILFWTILLIRLFLRSEWTFYLFVIVLIFWLMAGSSFGLKWYQFHSDKRAVILKQEVNALAGPDSHDTLLFKLHEGTIVSKERSEGGWILVSLPDKKRGWIKADAVEGIKRMPKRVT